MVVGQESSRGLQFLFPRTGMTTQFTPEMASPEGRGLAANVARFARNEVTPYLEDLKRGAADGYDRLKTILAGLGQLGLIAAEAPQKYGGSDISYTDAVVMYDALGYHLPLEVNMAFTVHTGIGRLPIEVFGSDDQKERWLGPMVRGEKRGVFALTGPDSGSNPEMSGMTARLIEEGGTAYWVLNGTKVFITDAAIADVAIVFASVDGKQLSAFLVPLDTPGVTITDAGTKMGISGSPTNILNFSDVRIPADGILGLPGQGKAIYQSPLSRSRWVILNGAGGTIAKVVDGAVRYALGRMIPDRRPIASQGNVKDYIATAALLGFSARSMSHRIAGDIEVLLTTAGRRDSRAMMDVWRDESIEAAIAKVFGSEATGLAIDQAMQVYGGYAYLVESGLPDLATGHRVVRLYEGENGLLRLFIAAQALLRMQKGEIPQRTSTPESLEERLASVETDFKDHPLHDAIRHAELAKEMAVWGLGLVVAHPALGMSLMTDSGAGQMLLKSMADLLILSYAIDGSVGRAVESVNSGDPSQEQNQLFAELIAVEYLQGMEVHARRLLAGAYNLLAAAGENIDREAYSRHLDQMRPDSAFNTYGHRVRIVQSLIDQAA